MEPDDEIAQLLEVDPQPKVNALKRCLSYTAAQAPAISIGAKTYGHIPILHPIPTRRGICCEMRFPTTGACCQSQSISSQKANIRLILVLKIYLLDSSIDRLIDAGLVARFSVFQCFSVFLKIHNHSGSDLHNQFPFLWKMYIILAC